MILFFVFVSLAFADCDFFQFSQAHCQVNWIIHRQHCGTVLVSLRKNVLKCCADQNIAPSIKNYTLVHADVNNLILKGYNTLNASYIDDQQFTLTQNGTDCHVEACSQSRDVSYYDQFSNYCDSFNLIRGFGFNITNQITSQCPFAPPRGKEEVTCNVF